MKMLVQLGVAALLFVPPPATPTGPLARSRWQRVLTAPQPLSEAEQCVIVDADLYAHAAPGLRDVRLVQDGYEIPYATDVSFDDRTGDAGAPPADDRSLYETVKILPLVPSQSSGATKGGSAAVPGRFYQEDLLSAHVPVERVRLEPAPAANTEVSLRAAARMNLAQAEELRTTLGPSRAAAPFTIGANLQDEADITVVVQAAVARAKAGVSGAIVSPRGAPPAPQSIVLEMRRREICFQPVSSSPVRLLLGDATALPPRYDYALHYQPKSSPLLATMGPMQPNPDYVAPVRAPRFRMTARLRLAIAFAVAVAAFFLTAIPLLKLTKR
ncbi:hypothetical protein Terro_3320 [Terriglobus roseus DSM 18391]|uniref:Uncharacterized protein n=1 Tax=Terriglobus roseus (strain DSM 18391 / NRRL B-41598 / KBS 63) TaxID=926566 RepID=I3ZJW9_TERRK|nr:hypothetical protein [Terriglobus roseus]AFL89537.1 hypothetical protein Terro_3320 [Terriglobus roseus DSM 18391]